MVHKVIFDEDPTTSDLGPWNRAGLGALPKFFGVDAKQLRRFL
jgi:hypothetical protein